MVRIAIPLTAASLLLAVAVSVSPARAMSESLSCQTINGQTVCVRGSGPGAGAMSSMSCQTMNGHTVCVGSGGLRCETAGDGRLVCRGGTEAPRLAPVPRPEPLPACERTTVPTPERRCEPRRPRTIDSLKGQSADAAVRTLGAPERARHLSSGARVLVWDRRAMNLIDGHLVVQQACELQVAVAKSGIVADVLLTGDPASCSRRLGLG